MGLLTDFRYALRSLAPGPRPGHHRHPDAGPRHRRQRRHLQRRPRRAAEAARQRRRGAADLHPADARRAAAPSNANFSVPEINDLKSRRQDDLAARRLLDARLHAGRPRRAARRARRRGQRLVLPGDGPAADPRPPDRRDRRWRRQAASVTVLTHRFWTDRSTATRTLLGKQIKLGDRASTIIGVLEPSVPYPAETS